MDFSKCNFPHHLYIVSQQGGIKTLIELLERKGVNVDYYRMTYEDRKRENKKYRLNTNFYGIGCSGISENEFYTYEVKVSDISKAFDILKRYEKVFKAELEIYFEENGWDFYDDYKIYSAPASLIDEHFEVWEDYEECRPAWVFFDFVKNNLRDLVERHSMTDIKAFSHRATYPKTIELLTDYFNENHLSYLVKYLDFDLIVKEWGGLIPQYKPSVYCENCDSYEIKKRWEELQYNVNRAIEKAERCCSFGTSTREFKKLKKFSEEIEKMLWIAGWGLDDDYIDENHYEWFKKYYSKFYYSFVADLTGRFLGSIPENAKQIQKEVEEWKASRSRFSEEEYQRHIEEMENINSYWRQKKLWEAYERIW